MYGSEFRRPNNNTFGLRCGQMRTPQITHNSGWYNAVGEKIGWGDLGPEDFLRIMTEIEPGEAFLVLTEQDSFWNFTRYSTSQRENVSNLDSEAPGVDYVMNHACWVVTHGYVAYIDHRGYSSSESRDIRGLGEVPIISADKLREIIEALRVS